MMTLLLAFIGVTLFGMGRQVHSEIKNLNKQRKLAAKDDRFIYGIPSNGTLSTPFPPSATDIPWYKRIINAIRTFEVSHDITLKKIEIGATIIVALLVLGNIGLFVHNTFVGTGILHKITGIPALVGKFGLLVGILSFLYGLFTGSFNILKFFGGFALWQGNIQGKLIFYGVIVALVSAVSFGVYHKLTEATYTANYKNTITATTVQIDERQILPETTYLFRIELLGLDIHFFNTTPRPKVTIANNTGSKTVIQTGMTKPAPVPKKKVKKATPSVIKAVMKVTPSCSLKATPKEK